jgi:uroporphyrinogen-III synthase
VAGETPDLGGARIGLLETRLGSELADLVRRYGGEPVSASAMQAVPRDVPGEAVAFIDALVRAPHPMTVFLTGVGAAGLFAEAERLGLLPDLLAALARATTVCRGPKPSAALRRHGVSISVSVPEPYTMTELLQAIAAIDLHGRWVGLVHYGERNAPLAEALITRGAVLSELQLYEWGLPQDTAPLRRLVQDALGGRLAALVFTSQVQVRHLFQIAAEEGRDAELLEALRARTVVASVGPVCSAALRQFGVAPHVEPEHPKMRPMMTALADYLTRHPRGA